MKIAVVGGGIAGMTAAYLLSRSHEVTLFEANSYIGGHTNTIFVPENGHRRAVDTGFVVFNLENYPLFNRLLNILGVECEPTRMSFSVQCEQSALEYCGSSLNALFCQRRNLLRGSFYRMILDILRFYRESPRLLREDAPPTTLGGYLREGGYSGEFIRNHLLPMASALWSSHPRTVMGFPARFLVQFLHNHGFLELRPRTRWRVIRGGSYQYVRRLTHSFRDRIRLNNPVRSIRRLGRGVELTPVAGEPARFERVVLAVHSDQALRMLADPTEREQDILSHLGYQASHTVLHTDSTLLPRNRRARASWNYYIPKHPPTAPTVTYYMNSLQSLRSPRDYCVTLNRTERIRPERIIRSMTYEHPVHTLRSVAAQRRHEEINGTDRIYYCGAYWGYGFHEDGVRSALSVCRLLGENLN